MDGILYGPENSTCYIHPARKHLVLEADCVSSRVMKIIFSIVSPIYDYRGGLDSFDNTDLLCSISVRTFNSLKRAGINSILEFAVEFKRNPEEVLKRRHLGRNSITELLGILGRIGFLTKTDNEP